MFKVGVVAGGRRVQRHRRGSNGLLECYSGNYDKESPERMDPSQGLLIIGVPRSSAAPTTIIIHLKLFQPMVGPKELGYKI